MYVINELRVHVGWPTLNTVWDSLGAMMSATPTPGSNSSPTLADDPATTKANTINSILGNTNGHVLVIVLITLYKKFL